VKASDLEQSFTSNTTTEIVDDSLATYDAINLF